MTINKAVGYAMVNICVEQDTNICRLTKNQPHGQSLQTKFNHVMTGRTRYPSIKTIHDFCCLTGYTLEEFFTRKEFDDLE